MALGILLILFVVMSVISILGLLFMYLVKDERKKKLIFYVMAVWGMAVAVLGAMSLPENYVTSQAVAWGLGALSVAALIINLTGKKEAAGRLAQLLITVSVVGGVLKIFFFI
ncbi:MAG TPA: hypothetical protein IAC50_04410 [Candidatus Copromorpha excrementigallinarum]|uniref:Uncharacterized protein n=1 Tax=Candidatus Allocopromorpha excrementigallinarum TaxID=2840742 RepID=A0A9D1L6G1_9FIRM|nr:hypothetical protein [Candidatus Copromorpha excrementigallinarum]